ncbi:phospholipase A [Algiphilus aromaticivorans]|jgi:phospholipase A1|uniref:phospholipase A n=1 Tax=Algiphilus aromaticivorans TaxID=382454 RepID=UPI0006949732|nr:phospholipase A [Algiphilus aromaticivorans]
MRFLLPRPLAACLFALALPVAAEEAASTQQQTPASSDGNGVLGFSVRSEEWTLIGNARGLSLHKPIMIFPATYSPDYSGEETEFIFQFSAKHQLLGTSLYFGYTQKSFWQLYNGEDSRPFRATNYNPELFYRWQPEWARLPELGLDFGLEHESNGRPLPTSRSWNRLYAGVFMPRGKSLYYIKGWWRIPERDRRGPDDAGGDDNPDIQDFLGYGELHYARQIGKQQQLALMLRGNPATGKGAVSLSWSRPNASGNFFYAVRLWHGYGESLIDYDRSITRLSIGVMLSR